MTQDVDWEMLSEREVARYLKVAPTTVRIWRIRGMLIQPDLLVAGEPSWSRQTMRSWAEQTAWSSPFLRDHVLSLLRVRGEAVSMAQVLDHCSRERLVPAGSGAEVIGAVLRDLATEGFIIDLGGGRYDAVPEKEAGSLDDRCLAVAGPLGRGQSFAAADMADALGIGQDGHSRVAAALSRLRDAGLLFPAAGGDYQGPTPSGIVWLQALGEERRLAGNAWAPAWGRVP